MAGRKRGGAGNRFERKASALALSTVAFCCALVVAAAVVGVVVVVVVDVLCTLLCVACMDDTEGIEADSMGAEDEEAIDRGNKDEEEEETEEEANDDENGAVVALASVEEPVVVGSVRVRGTVDESAGTDKLERVVTSAEEEEDPADVADVSALAVDVNADVDEAAEDNAVAALCACNSRRMLCSASSRLRCVCAKDSKKNANKRRTHECRGQQCKHGIHRMAQMLSGETKKGERGQHMHSHIRCLPSIFDFSNFCLISSND